MSNLIWLRMSLLLARGFDYETFKIPPSPNNSMILNSLTNPDLPHSKVLSDNI